MCNWIWLGAFKRATIRHHNSRGSKTVTFQICRSKITGKPCENMKLIEIIIKLCGVTGSGNQQRYNSGPRGRYDDGSCGGGDTYTRQRAPGTGGGGGGGGFWSGMATGGLLGYLFGGSGNRGKQSQTPRPVLFLRTVSARLFRALTFAKLVMFSCHNVFTSRK